MSTAAIETRYNGHLFRSRLEARWAAMFDLIGWQWTYEPFDGNGYIPDFHIAGAKPLVVEVKPAMDLASLAQCSQKVRDGLEGLWGADILLLGGTPTMRRDRPAFEGAIAGLLDEPGYVDWEHPGSDREVRWLDDAGWCLCPTCGQVAVFHHYASYDCRPCGHDHGDRRTASPESVQKAWGRAHELTRWKGR